MLVIKDHRYLRRPVKEVLTNPVAMRWPVSLHARQNTQLECPTKLSISSPDFVS